MAHAKVQYFAPALLTEHEREQQTQLIMKLFELWKLTYKQQAIALGLSTGTLTSIHKYKNGKQHLPLYRDIQDRVSYLLAIHKYLRRAYAFNKELAYRWMSTPNTDFGHLTPFDVVAREGFMGLFKIKTYLEQNQH